MSTDFWRGVATLPALAATAFVTHLALLATWDDRRVLGPRKYAEAKKVASAIESMDPLYRVVFFYGWTVIIGRQPNLRPSLLDNLLKRGQ